MTRDNAENFVGPMPVTLFLEEFVPEAPEQRPQDKFDPSPDIVSQKEADFIDAIHGAGLCPNMKLVNTTNQPMDRLKPDISVISRALPLASADDETLLSNMKWDIVELWIENKLTDPFFRNVKEMLTAGSSLASHVNWTDEAYRTCGQLIAYAEAMHKSQLRVFSFSVGIFGKTCRLFRWDRAGVIYTEPFDWANEPDTLFEFLWRFNFLSRSDLGYDTTVTSAEGKEAEEALPYLREYPGLEDTEISGLYKFLVLDDSDPQAAPRTYIAPCARWTTDSLVGRATYGYIAYDARSKSLVYLKDFWRVDNPEVQREGDVYRELKAAEVPHIAVLGPAGDVPMTPREASTSPLYVQRTLTQEYVAQAGRHEWCPGNPKVECLVHYRLVLETLGKPLSRFESSRELCQVIRDAIEAHSKAYEARILHRDVSAGNILIDKDGRGLLIDWDLSKKVGTGPRRLSRTGTWQFISVNLLSRPESKPHERQDDLESFFWVLLYHVVRYRSPAWQQEGAKEKLRQIFDQCRDADKKGVIRGGSGKADFLVGAFIPSGWFEGLVADPCSEAIQQMRTLFSDLYREMPLIASDFHETARERMKARRDRDPRVQEALVKVQSPDAMLSILDDALSSEWNMEDDGSLARVGAHSIKTPSGKKRLLEEVADSDSSSDLEVQKVNKCPPARQASKTGSSMSLRSLQPSQARSSTLVAISENKVVDPTVSASKSGKGSGQRRVKPRRAASKK